MQDKQGWRSEQPTLQQGVQEGLRGQHLQVGGQQDTWQQDVLQTGILHDFEEQLDTLQHDDLQTIGVHGAGHGAGHTTLQGTLHELFFVLHTGLHGLLHRILYGLQHGLLHGVLQGLLHGEAQRLDLDLFLNKGIFFYLG